MPRTPKNVAAKPKAKPSPSAKPKKKQDEAMESEQPAAPAVWRAGIDPIAEDEELDYDPTAYDCLHRFMLDWPCLSFDVVKDDLGGPRSTFPHTVFLTAGTQADSARQNYVAFLKLSPLGQGRHGKKAKKDDEDEEDEDEMDEDDDEDEVDDNGGDEPPKMHYRTINHNGGVNRIRSCPHQPGLVAVWGDTGVIKLIDGSPLLKELAEEKEPSTRQKGKSEIKPLFSFHHSTEGFALDWSPVRSMRLVSGDCNKRIHVWEPQEGGRWQVGSSFNGHEESVEDLQWSPTEETVFASCSVDKSIRIWDTRERGKSMISVADAHGCDVNVISWNRLVAYMLCSGADDGQLRIWDLRSFSSGSHVSQFDLHKGSITSVEWCPYEGSMLASSSADNQLAVWDLALERDPEEEEALAPEGNAIAPEDLPAQLLFLHGGQKDIKEVHWHSQIPGLIGSTAADGFNLFKASNM